MFIFEYKPVVLKMQVQSETQKQDIEKVVRILPAKLCS